MSDRVFVDASALCAILLDEPERNAFKLRIADADEAMTSPLAVFETVLAVSTRRKVSRADARRDVDDLTAAGSVRIVPITREIGALALDAHDRYGKGGGHPAKLNMGDCFAYACAKAHGVPLLYKGDDFACTDLA